MFCLHSTASFKKKKPAIIIHVSAHFVWFLIYFKLISTLQVCGVWSIDYVSLFIYYGPQIEDVYGAAKLNIFLAN